MGGGVCRCRWWFGREEVHGGACRGEAAPDGLRWGMSVPRRQVRARPVPRLCVRTDYRGAGIFSGGSRWPGIGASGRILNSWGSSANPDHVHLGPCRVNPARGMAKEGRWQLSVAWWKRKSFHPAHFSEHPSSPNSGLPARISSP